MLGEFGHIVASCTTPESVRDAFRAAIARDGYTTSACRAAMPSKRDGEWHNFFRDWPPSWQKYTAEQNLPGRSPVLAEARRRLSPFTWGDLKRGKTFTAAEREVWDAAASWGWSDGFVVPVHGPGGYFACVGMASPERDLDHAPDTRIRLQMLALLAHERCLALTAFAAGSDPRAALSPRELECLKWVAAGKTDWEIGMILGVAASTVKFHVDHAREKLGTRTRAQAVARLGPAAW